MPERPPSGDRRRFEPRWPARRSNPFGWKGIGRAKPGSSAALVLALIDGYLMVQLYDPATCPLKATGDLDDWARPAAIGCDGPSPFWLALDLMTAAAAAPFLVRYPEPGARQGALPS